MSFDAFAHERTALLAYARTRLPAGVDAEDVVAEVYEKTLATDWSVIENPRAWLFQVLRSKLADAHRKRGRELDRDTQLTVESSLELQPPSFDYPAGASCDCVEDWLAAEAPPQLDALRRVAWAEQTPAEAADALGISRGTFDVRLHRARRRSQALLAERCGITSLREARDCDCQAGCSSASKAAGSGDDAAADAPAC